MSKTTRLDETIEVARPLNEAFAYISEFNRIEEWDPAVAKGIRLTDGPLGVGTKFRIDMKAGFSLISFFSIKNFQFNPQSSGRTGSFV